MTEDSRKTPLPGWVAKAACGRTLKEQTEAVATWGNHGATPTLRAMTLAALELGQPAPTAGHVLLFGCYRPFSTPYLLRDIVALCRRLNIDHTWLDKEYCCGLPLLHQVDAAARGGVMDRAAQWLAANTAMAADKGARAQVYCCAGCAHTAKALRPARESVAGAYVLDVLLDALEGTALSITPLALAYFEGCHTSYRCRFPETSLDWGRYRQRLEAVEGLRVLDVANRKCCKTQAGDIIAAARESGAEALICACSGCNPALREAGRGVLPVLSYPELLLRCLPGQPAVPAA